MKIEIDKQFTVSLESLSTILSQYELVCLSYSEATSGIENSTLIVSTDRGKFVVRVYRQGKKNFDDIILEVDFVNYLRGNGIKVPRILRNIFNTDVSTLDLGSTVWQAIVMEFIEGVHAKTYTYRLLDELALTQARLHTLASGYDTANTVRSDKLNELHETFFIKQIDRKRITNILVTDFLDRVNNYVVSLDQNLPKGLCHLDYDNENALTKDGSLVAILDFDDLEIAPFAVCLSYTLWHIRLQAGQKAVTHYLSKYELIRPLSKLEKSYIQPIMLFRHYVISSIKILNNHLSANEINEYLSIEAELLVG